MSFKQIIGIVLAVIGFVLVVCAIHTKHQIAEAHGFSQDVNDFFTHNPWWNPIIEFFGGTPQKKPTEYHPSVLAFLITGLVCFVAGVATAIFGGKKKKKK